MIFIFLVLLVLLGLADTYILIGVVSKWPLYGKLLLLLPTLAYVAIIIRMLLGGDISQTMLNLLFWLTLVVVFTSILFCIFSLLGKGIGLFWNPGDRLFNIIGCVIAGIWLCMSLYGILFGWKKVTVEYVSITSSKLPESFKGYKIVQLSDFHIGTYGDAPATVDKIVERVNSLNPDLIVFTGDLVNSSADEIEEFKDVLSRMKAKDGIYSVLGNHDYCLYRMYVAPDTPERELGRVVKTEEEIGWKLLRNEAIQIRRGNDSIALVGVDNAGSRMFPDKSDLPKAVRGLPAGEFKILLSHDPSHWRREVLPTTDIDLTLSGHTHAMQFKIFGWSPSAWTYPEWGGLYREEDQHLYVSTGIGENIAFRFGAYPQIVLMTLK